MSGFRKNFPLRKHKKTYKKSEKFNALRAITITTGLDWIISKTMIPETVFSLRNMLVKLQTLLLTHPGSYDSYTFNMELYSSGVPTKLHFHGYIEVKDREEYNKVIGDMKKQFGFVVDKPCGDKAGWIGYITKQAVRVSDKIGTSPQITDKDIMEHYVDYENMAPKSIDEVTDEEVEKMIKDLMSQGF